MTEKDWKEIQKLRLRFGGTKKGIALCRLIEEKQRLDQIKKIVSKYDGSMPSMVKQFGEIQNILDKDN